MKKLNKKLMEQQMTVSNGAGMSVCNSCASCGCGGSRCVSTCKGCHDKDVETKSVAEVYSGK